MERVGIEALLVMASFAAGVCLSEQVQSLFWSEEKKLAAKVSAEEAKLRSKL